MLTNRLAEIENRFAGPVLTINDRDKMSVIISTAPKKYADALASIQTTTAMAGTTPTAKDLVGAMKTKWRIERSLR